MLLSNFLMAREAGRLASAESVFSKFPWIMLAVDIGGGIIQDVRNGESLTRIGSNIAARGGVGSTAIAGGTFLGSVLAGSKKGGAMGFIGGPKGSLGGAVVGGLLGGGAYVSANWTGLTDRISDEIYVAARGWTMVARYAWANRPRLRNLFN